MPYILHHQEPRVRAENIISDSNSGENMVQEFFIALAAGTAPSLWGNASLNSFSAMRMRSREPQEYSCRAFRCRLRRTGRQMRE